MSTKTEKPKGQFTIKGAILSFPHFTEAHAATEGGALRFGAELRIPKSNTEDVKKVQAFIDEIKKEQDKHKVRIFSGDICLKDGDTWEKAREEHKGHWILSANKAAKQGPPDLYGRKHSAGKIPNETDAQKAAIEKMFYPGCIVNAVVNLYFTKKGGGAKIPATLDVVQFWADGDRLGGAGQASLDDLPDADDDDSDGLDDEDEAPALD